MCPVCWDVITGTVVGVSVLLNIVDGCLVILLPGFIVRDSLLLTMPTAMICVAVAVVM